MILKNFLIGFGGVATITGVGIGVYYGTNSSENARKEIQALEIKVSENTKPDGEDIQDSPGSKDDSEKSHTSNK